MIGPLIPTAEGRRRYPETYGYMVELRSPVPCLCWGSCKALCTGECGCQACTALFTLFCAEAGCHPDTPRELEKAVIRYRGYP